MKPIPIHNLDDGGRRLMARAAEMACRDAYDVSFSDFLTPREQRIFHYAAASEGHGDRLFFWGGAVGAERRCAVFVPEWLLSDVPLCDPFAPEREVFLAGLAEQGVIDLAPAVTPVSLAGSEYSSLGHRDWLGSVLALGLERHVLGDIAVLDEHRAVAFFTARIAPFITESLRRAGNDAVRTAVTELPDGFEIPRRFERVEFSVASPRLDAIVKALTGLSRADAGALVKAADVELNYFPEENADAPVEDGDTLSIRGYGKFIIDCACGVTRRGRNRLSARKYL